MINKSLLKTLGPGILFASTAIGVSHLVQSTRAGAEYGFTLVWAVVLANLFKFPFFQYASRYANATGTSIIDGYKKLGKWMLWLYFIITISTMFFVCSAVGVVTSGFMDNLFGLTPYLVDQGIPGAKLFTPVICMSLCAGILALGKYNVLDSLIKIIGGVLLVSTLLAFSMAMIHGNDLPKSAYQVIDFSFFDFGENARFAFLIALMGWMPTALDLSSWNSLWTVERIKQTGYHPKMKETIFDFNFGYIVTAFLAIIFIALGAFLMYGTGETVPKSGIKFGAKVVEMYTSVIGPNSYYIIAPAVFSIMFGTLIAVLDGYGRSVDRIMILIRADEDQEKTPSGDSTKKETKKGKYSLAILFISLVSFFIMYHFVYKANANKDGFRYLIDFTTTFSFLVAPIIAVVNFYLMKEKYIGKEAQPPNWMKALSYIGILFLFAFSLLKLFA